MRARLQIFESDLNEIRSLSKLHNFRFVFYVIANVCVLKHVIYVVSWFNSAKHFEEKKKEKKKEEEKNFDFSKIEQIIKNDEKQDSDDRRKLKEKRKKRKIERKRKEKQNKKRRRKNDKNEQKEEKNDLKNDLKIE